MAEPLPPFAPVAPLGLGANALSLEEVVDRALCTVVTSAADVRARLERAFGVALPALGATVLTARGERLLGLQSDRLHVLFEQPAASAAKDVDPERALRERLAAAFDADGATDGETPDGAANGAADEVANDARATGRADGTGDGRGDAARATASDATASDAARDTDRAASRAGGRSLLYSSDQSDSWAMLRLDGPASRDVLERLCPLDLHPDVFAVGAVARSLVEHLDVIVLREGDDAFVLLSPRSSARSFFHDIDTAARHVRGGVA